jgi:hypothetical protein
MKAGQKEAMIVAKMQLWSALDGMRSALVATMHQSERWEDIPRLWRIVELIEELNDVLDRLNIQLEIL